MKVTLVGYGTRGDVQPFICLGAALRQRGHEVLVLAPRNETPTVRAAGLEARELPLNVQKMFAADAAQRMLAAGRINKFFRWLHEEEKAYLDDLRSALVSGCGDAEVIVCHPLVEDRCAAIGEARRVPVISIHFFPLLPTRAFPSAFIATRNLGPWLNKTTHRMMLEMLWRLSRSDVAALRRELGIAPARSSYTSAIASGRGSALLAYSPALAPTPPDWLSSQQPVGPLVPWPELRAQMGESGLPTKVESWLAAGPPPVFLGFGSMPVLNPPRLIEIARRSLTAVGARAVIAAGWSGLYQAEDDELLSVERIDHQALFPRCAAAVHHGGSGTVHASLAAGTPTLVCSVFADQPFWGHRCRQLGVGDTFAFKRLDERRLTTALRTVLDEPVRARARRLSERMAIERPLPIAIEHIENATPLHAPLNHTAARLARRGAKAGA
jgi:UDP:flavonoid glycosyltransferase YjiC (YdhE family)